MYGKILNIFSSNSLKIAPNFSVASLTSLPDVDLTVKYLESRSMVLKSSKSNDIRHGVTMVCSRSFIISGYSLRESHSITLS